MQRVCIVRSRSTALFTGPMVMYSSSPSLTSTATAPSSRYTNMCVVSTPVETSLSSLWETNVTCCVLDRSRLTRVRRWLLNWEDPTSRLRPARTTRAFRMLFCIFVRRWAGRWEEEMGRREKEAYTLPGQRAQICKSWREDFVKCCLQGWSRLLHYELQFCDKYGGRGLGKSYKNIVLHKHFEKHKSKHWILPATRTHTRWIVRCVPPLFWVECNIGLLALQ